MSKKTIAILFGGQSSEHEVSCISATTIISNINREQYDLVIIGITKEGKWLRVDNVEQIVSGEWRTGSETAVIIPDATLKSVVLLKNNKVEYIKVDAAFPVLHGLYGEDGTVQGLLELSKIPYVGCGVLSSSISMDKICTKIIIDKLNIRQAKYVSVLKRDLYDMEKVVASVEEIIEYPVFIKPSNAGSSKGISKATNREELKEGIIEASNHDRRILVEEMIVGRELECAVLGGLQFKASGIGEILAEAEFYDYEAKYNSTESKTVISPVLPDGKEDEIKNKAVEIFKALDGYGIARVDFFLEKDTNEVVFNEMNTMPGFTSISMYPMLWEAKGIGKPQLIDKLIQSALVR